MQQVTGRDEQALPFVARTFGEFIGSLFYGNSPPPPFPVGNQMSNSGGLCVQARERTEATAIQADLCIASPVSAGGSRSRWGRASLKLDLIVGRKFLIVVEVYPVPSAFL